MDNEKILNIILKEIFNAPTQDDILSVREVKNGMGSVGYSLSIGGVPLPENRVQGIIEAAEQLYNNELFQLLLNEYEYDGSKRMAVEAADWERVRFAKAFIYGADFMRRKVDQIRNLHIPEKKGRQGKPKTNE